MSKKTSIKIYTDKEKITQFLDIKGISKNKFYKETGLSNGFLDSGSSFSLENLRLILDKYRDLNPDWLIKGTGEMILPHIENVDEWNSQHKALERRAKQIKSGEISPKEDNSGISEPAAEYLTDEDREFIANINAERYRHSRFLKTLDNRLSKELPECKDIREKFGTVRLFLEYLDNIFDVQEFQEMRAELLPFRQSSGELQQDIDKIVISYKKHSYLYDALQEVENNLLNALNAMIAKTGETDKGSELHDTLIDIREDLTGFGIIEQ